MPQNQAWNNRRNDQNNDLFPVHSLSPRWYNTWFYFFSAAARYTRYHAISPVEGASLVGSAFLILPQHAFFVTLWSLFPLWSDSYFYQNRTQIINKKMRGLSGYISRRQLWWSLTNTFYFYSRASFFDLLLNGAPFSSISLSRNSDNCWSILLGLLQAFRRHCCRWKGAPSNTVNHKPEIYMVPGQVTEVVFYESPQFLFEALCVFCSYPKGDYRSTITKYGIFYFVIDLLHTGWRVKIAFKL